MILGNGQCQDVSYGRCSRWSNREHVEFIAHFSTSALVGEVKKDWSFNLQTVRARPRRREWLKERGEERLKTPEIQRQQHSICSALGCNDARLVRYRWRHEKVVRKMTNIVRRERERRQAAKVHRSISSRKRKIKEQERKKNISFWHRRRQGA